MVALCLPSMHTVTLRSCRVPESNRGSKQPCTQARDGPCAPRHSYAAPMLCSVVVPVLKSSRLTPLRCVDEAGSWPVWWIEKQAGGRRMTARA